MRLSGEGDALSARVGVGGPPGIDRDAVAACLRARGFDVFIVTASTLNAEVCDALVFLEPRARDWEAARAGDLPVVLIHTERLTPAAGASHVFSGADAFVSVDDSVEQLVHTLRTVVQGGTVLDPAVARTVARAGRRHEVSAQDRAFTLRERDIIESMKAGHSVKETARLMGLSVRTVHEAQRWLFEKIGARNRAHALSLMHSRVNHTAAFVPNIASGDHDLRSSG